MRLRHTAYTTAYKLLELIARQVRERQQTANKLANEKYMQQQLAAMASDSDIQAEIAAIAGN